MWRSHESLYLIHCTPCAIKLEVLDNGYTIRHTPPPFPLYRHQSITPVGCIYSIKRSSHYNVLPRVVGIQYFRLRYCICPDRPDSFGNQHRGCGVRRPCPTSGSPIIDIPLLQHYVVVYYTGIKMDCGQSNCGLSSAHTHTARNCGCPKVFHCQRSFRGSESVCLLSTNIP